MLLKYMRRAHQNRCAFYYNKHLESCIQISLSENKRGYHESFRTNYKEIKNTKPKDLPIYGVVVTGKTEDLQSLQGAPYIKAAVRGVTVEKY